MFNITERQKYSLDTILPDSTPGISTVKEFLRFCLKGKQSIIIGGALCPEARHLHCELIEEDLVKNILIGTLESEEDSWLFVRSRNVMPVIPIMCSDEIKISSELLKMCAAMQEYGETENRAMWLVANSVDIAIDIESIEGKRVISSISEVRGSESGIVLHKVFEYDGEGMITCSPPTTILCDSIANSDIVDETAWNEFVNHVWDGQMTLLADENNKASGS
jgi:hypothetical protein